MVTQQLQGSRRAKAEIRTEETNLAGGYGESLTNGDSYWDALRGEGLAVLRVCMLQCY